MNESIRLSEDRTYPPRPILGVGAVIVLEGRVVLVKRGHQPLAGRWSLPGGALELGESIHDALVRETREETGLVVTVGELLEVVEHVEHDHDGRARYHFVIVDYLCWPAGGAINAGGDAEAVALADPATIGAYELTDAARAVIRRGLERHAARETRS